MDTFITIMSDISYMDAPRIERPRYLAEIEPYIGNRNAKVLTGIRRCGKSTLLEMLTERMGDGANIMVFDMEAWDNRQYRDPDALYSKIKESLAEGRPNCLFVDEVQDIREWESVIRSLISERCCDIYLTGSNSKLLSGEFATYLSGRLNKTDVFTLTLSECVDFEKAHGRDGDPEKILAKFIRIGGFPGVWCGGYRESYALREVSDTVDTIIKRDITDRHSIRNTDLLDRILNYFCDSIGNCTSVNNVYESLRSADNTVVKSTVYDYVEHLEEAYLIVKVPTYDIKGRKHLTSKHKYYLSDIGIKNARLGFRPDDMPGLMENIIYLELRSKGYSVSVGDADGREVDFVAEKDGRFVYVQATTELSNEDVVRREFGNLKKIQDNYPKYVVTLNDGLLNTDMDGVRCVKLADFLMMPEY